MQSDHDDNATEEKMAAWVTRSDVVFNVKYISWRWTSRGDQGEQFRVWVQTSNLRKQQWHQTSVQMDMNNLKTSNLYKYYKSIDSIK